ncbi:MAG: tRNA pseudouridine(55) synthase TruB [Lachnospiraceae bacterium]|nr:tRNA pseudouridine(55) synthase TruB [Lachnospiraceae bacterium]
MRSEAAYCGIINVFKEAGYTSNDVVAKLRGILRMRKIGHTGTLDPQAVGVLPVCLGPATRICSMLTDEDKEYECVCRLGVTTDTLDMTGTVTASVPDEEVLQKVSPELLAGTAGRFVCTYEQLPPMYSAVKIGGKKLYEYARRGETVERRTRSVTIHSLDITDVSLPVFKMRIRCSKGTYIRSLCSDIGDALGTGAVMESLVRTRVGRFGIDSAVSLERLENIMKTEPEKIPGCIMTLDEYFDRYARIIVKPDAARFLLNGNPVRFDQAGDETFSPENGDIVRMCDDNGRFLALYSTDCSRELFIPYKMFLL